MFDAVPPILSRYHDLNHVHMEPAYIYLALHMIIENKYMNKRTYRNKKRRKTG